MTNTQHTREREVKRGSTGQRALFYLLPLSPTTNTQHTSNEVE